MLPTRLILLLGIAAAALVALTLTAVSRLVVVLPTLTPFDVFALCLGAMLAIYADLRPIRFLIGRERTQMSLTVIAYLPIVIVYGWPAAIIIMLFSQIGTDLHSGKPWYKAMYNSANFAVAIFIAHHVYALFSPNTAFLQGLPMSLVGGAAAGATFFLVNTTLVSTVISLAQGIRFLPTMVYNLSIMIPVSASRISLGIIATALWSVHPVLILPLLAPLVSTKSSYENFVRLVTETDNFIVALADAIDMRDPYTAQHSARVANLCRALGERLGMQGKRLKDFEAIARVHDVGKIAVPDAVLLKPGRLTEPEFALIKEHVDAGVRILSGISLYKANVGILHEHHERLDGSGYPRGLRDSQISLEGRVIAAVDTYDAITTDRPYRKARTPLEAMQELYLHITKHYDFAVVRALEDELLSRQILPHPVLSAPVAASRMQEPDRVATADRANQNEAPLRSGADVIPINRHTQRRQG